MKGAVITCCLELVPRRKEQVFAQGLLRQHWCQCYPQITDEEVGKVIYLRPQGWDLNPCLPDSEAPTFCTYTISFPAELGRLALDLR